jgi:hypothetical protein
MRTVIVALLSALCVFETASAQPLFVLVDRSSSISPAETNASKRLLDDLLKTPGEDVSITRFGAENGGSCATPVEISPLAPRAGLKFDLGRASGSTPIVGALEAALPKAAEAQGRILIVTDGREGCGRNLCVARQRLAQIYPETAIELKFLGDEQADLDAQDALGCLNSPSPNDMISGSMELPPQISKAAEALDADAQIDAPNAKGKTVADETTPFEKWFWVLGFALIAFSAVKFGLSHAARARTIENSAKDVQSLRNSILLGEDPDAERKLRVLINQQQAEAKDYNAKDDGRKLRKWWRRPFGLLGGTMLVILAALPPEWNIFGFRLGVAQDRAWDVLNSNFATAFAVMAIALIFFAGRQYQRRTEAEHNYAIATDEAKRTAEARRTTARKLAYSAYERTRDKLTSIDFRAPWRESLSFRSTKVTDADRKNYELVQSAALKFAQGDTLDPTLSNDDEISKETRRIEALIPKFTLFGAKPDFGDFIAQLLRNSALRADPNIGEWVRLRESIEAGNNSILKASLKELAQKLPTA